MENQVRDFSGRNNNFRENRFNKGNFNNPSRMDIQVQPEVSEAPMVSVEGTGAVEVAPKKKGVFKAVVHAVGNAIAHNPITTAVLSSLGISSIVFMGTRYYYKKQQGKMVEKMAKEAIEKLISEGKLVENPELLVGDAEQQAKGKKK